MTKVYITVGIPASGKSSYTKKMNSNNEFKSIRFSSDEIREVNPSFSNAEVFDMMSKGVETCLKSEEFDEIYYDATNTSRRRRRGLYRNIKTWDKNAEVIILFFSVPYFYALEKNREREGVARVPDDVILRMHRQLQIPRLGVDCDNFHVIGVPILELPTISVGNPSRVEDIFKVIDYRGIELFGKNYWTDEVKLSDSPHFCSPWHEESIFEHINMCIDNSEYLNMKRVSFWHDLGKGICQEVDETGYATYRGHANVSAHYYLNYLALTRYYNEAIPNEDLDIVEIISKHMDTHNGLGEKNIRNNRITDDMVEFLEEFARIDKKSRIIKENEEK